MRKKNLIIGKKAAALFAAIGCAVMLAACGSAAGNDPATQEDAGTQESGQSDSGADNAAADTKTDSDKKGESAGDSGAASTDPKDALVGEWEFAYSIDHSDYDEGESYDYCTMCTDSYAPDSAVNVRKEGDKYIADYRCSYYESDFRLYGSELKYLTEPAYKDCKNSEWCMEMSDPMATDNVKRRITMLDDETLIETEEYESDPSEEYYYHSISTKTYFKKDSPKFDNKEDIRYFNTYTVSNEKELFEKAGNNTKLILKAGTYDISGVNPGDYSGLFGADSYISYLFSGVSNFCLEAEEGADVEVLIDDPYNPVLAFENGNNITLRNLTVGHNVEKGYCSGSVVYLSGIQGVTIDGCRLYGCGTYGIEATSCSEMDITSSEIYECTYGLLDLRYVSNAAFKDCIFRDSEDMSMINTDSCYGIGFDNCTFKNNKASTENSYFVQQTEYDDVIFRKCTFSDNEYNIFSNYEVKMEDCEIKNNVAKYSDIISTQKVDDVTDLKALYAQALEKQEEIDKRFETDEILDQMTMNQLSYESFELWDNLLNRIWTYLGNTMDEKTFATLTENQKEWITNKEAAKTEAGKDFEGGSMQPMVENNTAADWTKKRASYLLDKYLSD